MNQALEQLRSCSNAHELKPLLLAICSGFGEVVQLDVLVSSQIGKRQAMCFMRMATLEQEQRLMRELCMGRFGGDVVLIVDLQPEIDKPSELNDFSDELDAGGAASPRDFQPTLPIASYTVAPNTPSMLSPSRPSAQLPARLGFLV